jgi:hypothetical protein
MEWDWKKELKKIGKVDRKAKLKRGNGKGLERSRGMGIEETKGGKEL